MADELEGVRDAAALGETMARAVFDRVEDAQTSSSEHGGHVERS
jgi:hypothetical protein